MNTTTTPEGAGEFPPLKPCPFCGGAPEIVDDRTGFFVRCNHCKPSATVIYGENVRHLDCLEDDAEASKAFASVDWDTLKLSAIDAWNRRTPVAATPESAPTLDYHPPSRHCGCAACAPSFEPAPASEAVAWFIDTHGVQSVALKKEDLGLLANRYARPLVFGDATPQPAAPSQPPAKVEREGLTEAQIEVLQFLYGTGKLRDCGFGERPAGERGLYWWRTSLRAAFPGIPAPTVGEKENGNG